MPWIIASCDLVSLPENLTILSTGQGNTSPPKEVRAVLSHL